MSNWWARQLGGEAPPPAAPAPTYPPAQPQYSPYQPQYPPTTHQAPGHKREVNKGNYMQVISDPASYEGMVTASAKAGDTTNCPGCGSPRYFSRAKEGRFGSNGAIPPKPMCADCGYPMRQGPGA